MPPATQWDGGNRQVPGTTGQAPKPQGAELTARHINFSWLRRRAADACLPWEHQRMASPRSCTLLAS
jgi:hypothetical protein